MGGAVLLSRVCNWQQFSKGSKITDSIRRAWCLYKAVRTSVFYMKLLSSEMQLFLGEVTEIRD